MILFEFIHKAMYESLILDVCFNWQTHPLPTLNCFELGFLQLERNLLIQKGGDLPKVM